MKTFMFAKIPAKNKSQKITNQDGGKQQGDQKLFLQPVFF